MGDIVLITHSAHTVSGVPQLVSPSTPSIIAQETMDLLKKILEATVLKRSEESRHDNCDRYQYRPNTIEKEYEELEQVPPAPGQAWQQHDQMVKLGLCNM